MLQSLSGCSQLRRVTLTRVLSKPTAWLTNAIKKVATLLHSSDLSKSVVGWIPKPKPPCRVILKSANVFGNTKLLPLAFIAPVQDTIPLSTVKHSLVHIIS